jgi:hypothetical protein
MDPEINQHIQHERSMARQREREEVARRIENGEVPWQEQEGVMSVIAAVRDLEFPRSFDGIRSDAGNREVITTRHKTHPLTEVLDVVENHVKPGKDPVLEDGRIPSVQDFQEIVQHHWEAVRFHDVPEDERPPRGGAQPQDPRTHR